MNWEQSSLNPPIWWQLRLAEGMLNISIRLHSNGCYCASIGTGYHTREAAFSTLQDAKKWGMKEARKVLKAMDRELVSRYYLLETCLVIAIALGVVWLTGKF
ncbi:hypothetical protein H6G36_25365 [Anabaena minutissima FACHB-250]|nr:hypothetical protein [Anabaena minutissima FACHB-250]